MSSEPDHVRWWQQILLYLRGLPALGARHYASAVTQDWRRKAARIRQVKRRDPVATAD